MMKRISAAILVASVLASPRAFAAERADTILLNGKILTVDQRFSIGQAVAIRGQRIIAVGKNADVLERQGPGTKVIDLKTRTVIPGLIDNHAHFIRAPEHDELRLDGVTSRARALAMLAARVRGAAPGEWIVTLGGWAEDQFADDPRGFPLEELDRIAPENPVVLQAVYIHSYLNSAALKAAGMDASTPDPRGGTIEKDAAGRPTGLVSGAGGVAFVAARIPLPDKDQWLANVRKFVAGLNAMGITAWYDAGGRGVDERHYEAYRALAERGELNARVFWTTIRQPATPEQVDKVLAEIQQATPFQGSDTFDNIGWGESVYLPATTNLLRNDFVVKPEDMRQVRRIVQAIAEGGMFLNAHVEMENAIDAYLDEFEAVNKVEPIKGLRWALSHLDQVTDAQLERMKRLGLYAGLHSRPLIQGALMHAVHGERAWDMPPFKRVQESGIVWGLGSDATAVTPSNPFYTLWFAVTGRMIGGRKVNRQTVSREQALIAHTRSNAKFVFQENNLGSIAPGKYADLLVLDRDYLAVPSGQIKDIRPVMTMVGGRIVYQAKP
ncbi:MAG TPA: amidohydrolase [Burkholderiales bacterium]|nr:amidohydrolase [Burkholderiales bacterium]